MKTTTTNERLSKYDTQFKAQLLRHCITFKLIGTPSESPRWFAFKGTHEEDGKTFAKFQSSQTNKLFFYVELLTEDVTYFQERTNEVYDYFRALKYSYLHSDHPTIETGQPRAEQPTVKQPVIEQEEEQETDYEKQANDFLKKVGAKLTVEYIDHNYYFPEDKVCRDIYRFTIKRNGKSYTAKFGQSINNTGIAPTAYDILSCLTKYEVGTFDNFCSEFGYYPINGSEEYEQAQRTYKAVKREEKGVNRLFSDVLEQLQEIQ